MSLKEFDYKQFLLEKGERVGLGIAVTLMVLMLIFNLFMPQKGFFSGSPKTMSKELVAATDKLDDALRNRQPGSNDLPEKREGRLIQFDKTYLVPDNYATPYFFEPRIKENPARRPPKIYNVEEAIAVATAVNIDTYLFNKDFTKVWVLADKEGRRSAPGGGGGGNPFSPLGKGGGGPMGGPGGGANPMLQMQQQMQMQQRMRMGNANPNAGQQFTSSDSNYEPKLISTDNWNPQEQTAHQLRPLRMTIIAGSFPYKEQLREHQNKLHLPSTDAVLSETVGEGENKSAAFDFRGVEVQRMEVDKDGKPLGEWLPLDLKGNYELWLKNTYYPFEPEDSKYAVVKPNEGKGLVMPLLRAFHGSKASSPGLSGLPGLMGGGKVPPGGPQLPKGGAGEPPSGEEKSPYSDVEKLLQNLPKLQKTLASMQDVQPNKIVAPKFQSPKFLDPFNPNVTLPSDGGAQQPQPTPTKTAAGGEQDFIPDYAMVRVVDVYDIKPGKHYRYRMKIKMVNPNYKNDNVASPEYKEKDSLESKDWYEVPQIVSVPEELFYYVVDEKQGASRREIFQMPRDTAQYELWNQPSPGPDQVVFQFQRWVESTQRSRKEAADMVPVGEWAVADRVYVARGEYVGRQVKVDLPMWIWTRNAFILPEENPKAKTRGRVKTGIYVEFGQENPEDNLILLDFEGGRVSSQSPKMDDTCPIEVLMLSPDGKLLARNSYKDTKDGERSKRREEALKRIHEVREGKKE